MILIPTNIKNEKLVARRREQLIKSGIKLFGQKGFHGTTLKDLAEDAGISYGNIYDYVGCKEDIFFLIHDFLYRKSMELYDRSVADLEEPIERLRGIIDCEFKIMDRWSEATLLMYQESHILNKTYLKELLNRERHRLGKMEACLEECAKHGLLRPCNVRLTANLIKSMLDAWVLKRWDLRGIVSRREAEQAMVDLVLNGLLKDQGKMLPAATKANKSNCALIANGGTILGKALSVFLAKKGLRVIAYINRVGKNRENLSSEHESICFYTADKDGPLRRELFERIERENGPVNIFIQDMGVGNTAMRGLKAAKDKSGGGLDTDFLNAHKSSEYLFKTMAQRTFGRIVFMAPWAWDCYLDSIHYETAKAATVAMTHALSRDLAPTGVNVNCIVPGYIKSTRPSPLEKKFSDKVADSIPKRCLGEIQDILDAVWFLVSNGSDFITGEVLNITGGS